jgi:sugar O-acyltransferase (sialic acid O-acetyltransferase NeuD family)
MRDLVIFGTGGFARETRQIAEDINQNDRTWNLVGFLDENTERHGDQMHDLPVLGGLEWLKQHPRTVVAVAVGGSAIRRKIVFRLLHADHTRFATLVHPLAWISRRVEIGPGTVIDAGALISPDARIGEHVILNNNCTIGHDTVIEDYVTVAPNASVAGEVHIGEGCDIGANCTIIQRKSIGHWSVVGAGAVVVKDVPPNVTAVGVPASPVKERPEGWYRES